MKKIEENGIEIHSGLKSAFNTLYGYTSDANGIRHAENIGGKADGEILAYHIYNRNFFEQYLLDNTVLECASTTKHSFMRLYEEDGKCLLSLICR